MFGRNKRLISENNRTEGTITSLKECRWLKINTKPVRTHSLDGALFPYVINFKYSVNDIEYKGKKFIGINTRGLKAGEKITVYYDKSRPSRYGLSDNIYGREIH